ncbi:MAG TPA: VOC family protein [Frankiaceae bacterium]|jgi:catechol 2,3-dioxygenase-like lactoylglutathione lyase family enzyme|nr:VOC family protein [Frankiaceae bacterium]
MAVTNVSHIAIAVSDVEQALPFWTGVVGLHVTLDTIEEFAMSARPFRRRAVYLRQREGAHEPFLVLDQPCEGAAPGEVKAMFDLGVHHVGFWVDDIDEIAGRAHATGVPVISGPVTTDSVRYGEAAGTQVRTFLVRDPDGNVIQFDQRLTDRDSLTV